MKLVVVGGQARKVGKTSVMAGLIRGLNMLAWTAVKVSYHSGETGSHEAPSPDELPPRLEFLLSEENNPKGHADTSLYLAAGARRALWLRARDVGLSRALPSLLDALRGDEHVIVESNSLIGFLKPAVFLMVVGEPDSDVKASARQYWTCADAFVAVQPGFERSARLAPHPLIPEGKPVFPVSADEWSNPNLSRFVSERIAAACDTEG